MTPERAARRARAWRVALSPLLALLFLGASAPLWAAAFRASGGKPTPGGGPQTGTGTTDVVRSVLPPPPPPPPPQDRSKRGQKS